MGLLRSKSANIGRLLFFVVVLAFAAQQGDCATIIVKADGTGDYPTIQAAITDANDGDEIICEDGVYTGAGNINVYFLGKAITLRSENGPENCIVDCNNSAATFNFSSYEEANSVLQGFTIENADPNYGVIYCSESSPVIIDCVITDAVSGEGGIYCYKGGPTITNCVITNNFKNLGSTRGGIFCGDSNAVITGCQVMWNGPAGIWCEGGSEPIISSCTIAENQGGGIVGDLYGGFLTVTNSILWNNGLYEIEVEDVNGIVTATYSNVHGGWEGEGNIDIEPGLTKDGHLTAGSACINAGDPTGDYTSQVDMDGEGRVFGGRVDMGCDEFVDTDSDGLPDFWESRYFGSATAAGPEEDPDGDGLTNIDEYEVYGSDPTAASVTYYVDVNDGDDSYDGLAPEWDGEHGPKHTIQAGIDTAANTDTVIVAPGVYIENITFDGKGITLRSSEPSDWDVVKNTIIDGSQPIEYYDSCVSFEDYEDETSVLDGFTLTKGEGSYASFSHRDRCLGRPVIAGGGVLCLHSSPVIRRCNIVDNGGDDFRCNGGGGIALLGDCRAVVSNCVIAENKARGGYNNGGSGIVIRSNMPETAINTIENCTIVNNVTEDVEERYQVDCWDSPTIIRNTIIWPGPLEEDPCDYYPPDEEPDYERCLLISEASLVSYSCFRESFCLPERQDEYDELDIWKAEWCDLAGTGGNIDDAPFFVQPLGLPEEDYDHHLLYNSPSCINAGDPNYTNDAGETDIDGQLRVMGGRVDIGADEVVAEIVVRRPAAGEVWTTGSTHKIKWDSWGCNGPVSISYSTDGGADWDTIDTGVGDSGSYNWSLPKFIDSNQCVVSVESADANVVCVASGMFTVQKYQNYPSVTSSWKTLGNDFDRSGLSEYAGPELGCLKWRFETDGAVTASVTLGKDDRVHIGCEDGKLYSVDANGTLLWSYDVNAPLLSSPTVGPDGTVYVGGLDKRLYAINPDGGIRWTHTTDGFVYSSPAVSNDGEVYVCSEDGTVYALGADGSELWEFETAGVGTASGAIFASPAIGAGGDIYIGSVYEPNLYALDGNDGSVKWVCHFADACDPNFDGNWPFASPVVAADGTIYQTLLYSPKRFVSDFIEISWSFGYEAKLYAIDPNNGDIIWDCNMSDTAREPEEIPDPNEEPESYWFEQYYVDAIESGMPPYPFTETRVMGRYWMRYYRVSGSSFSSSALGPDGTIYVSFDDAYLRAVDPNGTMKWVSRLGMVGGPTLAVGSDGLIYAASEDGYLSVVDSSGEEVARFEGEEGLSCPVISSDGTLIVSDANNTVWAIGEGDCEGEVSVLHRVEDMDGSGGVDYIDLAVLVNDWLSSNECSPELFYYPASDEEPCTNDGPLYITGDVDRSLYVDLMDYAMIADKWLSED